jgi:hypothetical protein
MSDGRIVDDSVLAPSASLDAGTLLRIGGKEARR